MNIGLKAKAGVAIPVGILLLVIGFVLFMIGLVDSSLSQDTIGILLSIGIALLAVGLVVLVYGSMKNTHAKELRAQEGLPSLGDARQPTIQPPIMSPPYDQGNSQNMKQDRYRR